MDEWKDILSRKEGKLTDEELLRYLHENMPEEEKSSFEKKLTGSFETDAIEGLQQIKDKEKLHSHVHQLNQKLPHLLRHKKQRLNRKRLKDFQWSILTILILLFLCIITYVIIRMHV